MPNRPQDGREARRRRESEGRVVRKTRARVHVQPIVK